MRNNGTGIKELKGKKTTKPKAKAKSQAKD